MRASRTRFVAAAIGMLVAFLATRATVLAAAPGGVTGAAMWFAASGYNGTTWTDQSGSGLVTTAPAAPTGSTAPTAIALDANFNPGVGFNGTSQRLLGGLSTNAFASANSYMFSVSNTNVVNPGLYTFGDTLSGYGGPGQGILYYAGAYGTDTQGNYGPGPFTVPAATTIVSEASYPTAGSGVGGTMSENGLTASASVGNGVTASTAFEIGARTTGGYTGRLFTGTIDEVIYFSGLASPLSATQISEIQSYLALKYGVTLGFNTQTDAVTGTNYLSSAGATIWSGATNAGYNDDVAGVGKDATSGLDQRVSHSINSSAYGNALDVTIANGTTLSTASQAANTPLSADRSFVMWGDNGASIAMSTVSNVYRMARVWRAQTTGTGSTKLTVQVPASAFTGVAIPAMFVAADANFQTSLTVYPLTCGSTSCTATISTFSAAQSSYYTFGGRVPIVNVVLAVTPTGGQLPGTVLTYMSTFTNNGTISATGVVLGDAVPANTDFAIGSVTTSLGTSGLTPTVEYSNDNGSTWTYTPVSAGGGAATGYDRNVTNVRIVFGGTLPYAQPNNTGSFGFAVIIR